MPEEQGLSVRQAKRHDLAFDADMWIAPEDAGRVRISSSAGARGDKLRVTVVDASSGGIGIVSPVYIPRRCGVIVRALNPQDASRTPLLETKLLVQRTRMTDRRPAYLLGASFAPLGGAEVAGVARFLALLDDQSVEGASPAPGNGTEARVMLDTGDFVVRDLLEQGRISDADVDIAKRHGAEHSLDVLASLIALSVITSRDAAIARAVVSECPFIELDAFDVDIHNASLLPRGVANKIGAFPLFNLGPVVTVGMVDPLNLRAVDQVRQHLKVEIDPVLCDEAPLRALIERAYSMAPLAGPAERDRAADSEAAIGEEPIVAAVNQIIGGAIDDGASDIHINPDERELHLRCRVDGVLQTRQGPALSAHAALVQRLKVMAGLDLTQSRRPQDGKFRFVRRDQPYDIRISVVPTVSGENVVMRILARGASVKGFGDLGIAPTMIESLETLIARPHGMILATGPTGSGKTTTLYTALSRLNSPHRNVMTIEDPVEIRLPMVRQTQVNPEIGLTFAGALRSILRQDPDVILVGEIRDTETAQIAVQAALTGHLVLSTLHTNDAMGALSRLRDLGVPAFAVNAALLGVAAQRLVRRVCEHCARADAPDPLVLRRYGLDPGDTKGLMRGTGCAKCMDTGYRGRVGVYELLVVSPRVQSLIESGAAPQAIRAAAGADGMRPMWLDGLEKARIGLTTLEELAKLRTGFDDLISSDEAPSTARAAQDPQGWRLSA